ncbi:hypothetical protein BaRGS_00034632 [Batillaria attramentaria]|uniref:Uncharacterized protein n=1 Tax=Batillaria attramentaria TaxID=370345 RepID=A0ABD0JGX0_9CAEN
MARKSSFLSRCVVVHVLCSTLQAACLRSPLTIPASIRFLLTVNVTQSIDTGKPCMATVLTPMLKSEKLSQPVHVGPCDHGPLIFNVTQGGQGSFSQMQVAVTFFSTVIEDAEPPSCQIPWNGSYLNPTTDTANDSPLPACWVQDSREGWHLTYYWIRLLDWEFP